MLSSGLAGVAFCMNGCLGIGARADSGCCRRGDCIGVGALMLWMSTDPSFPFDEVDERDFRLSSLDFVDIDGAATERLRLPGKSVSIESMLRRPAGCFCTALLPAGVCSLRRSAAVLRREGAALLSIVVL